MSMAPCHKNYRGEKQIMGLIITLVGVLGASVLIFLRSRFKGGTGDESKVTPPVSEPKIEWLDHTRHFQSGGYDLSIDGRQGFCSLSVADYQNEAKRQKAEEAALKRLALERRQK